MIVAISDKDGDNHKKDIYNSFCVANEVYENLTPCYSNPCFELYLDLHKNMYYSAIDRVNLRSKYENEIGPSFKTEEDIFELFATSLQQAIKNCMKLNEYWENEVDRVSYCNRNPSTSVSEGVKKLKSVYDKSKNK